MLTRTLHEGDAEIDVALLLFVGAPGVLASLAGHGLLLEPSFDDTHTRCLQRTDVLCLPGCACRMISDAGGEVVDAHSRWSGLRRLVVSACRSSQRCFRP